MRTPARPYVSWHRGGSENFPSASADAFFDAARRGADFIEVDVRVTSDNVLVCVHDDVVPGLGPVHELAWIDLDETERGSILRFDTFCDTLDALDPGRHTGVHLDLKDVGYELDAVDFVLSSKRPLFVTMPFDESITLLRRERPHVDAFLTIGTSRSGLSRRARVRLRSGEIFPMRRLSRCGATGIAIHHRLAIPLVLWWCRRHQLGVVVWTVDRTGDINTWLSREIVAVTTNRPIFALSCRAELERSRRSRG